jgi:hypothetical protein
VVVKAISLVAAAISLFIPALVHAELKWEQTTIEFNPGITEKQVVGHFKYENTGKEPVRFKSVKASCGCTAAQTQKDEVPPGEKGEITATFTLGDRTGHQVKTVTVQTDDAAHPVTVLTLKANIAQVLELTPNFVFWQAGDKPEPKTIIAKVGKDVPIKELQVTSTNPQFEAKVEKGPAAGQFRININPKETQAPAFATVMVKTDYPKESPKTFYITARVTGKPAALITNPQGPVAAASSTEGQ